MNFYSYRVPQWRYAELIDALKPYHSIVSRLHEKGYPLLPISSIAGWRRRNTIPAPWVPAMIELGMESRVISGIKELKPPQQEKSNVTEEDHFGTDGSA